MRKIVLSAMTVAAFAALTSFAQAQQAAEGALTGAGVGAATGFVVGGPVGAAVGAGIGGTVGAAAGDTNRVPPPVYVEPAPRGVIVDAPPVSQRTCVTDAYGNRTCTEVVR